MDDWRKSTYSDGNGGQCVEAASGKDAVMVRDTTDRNGGMLAFSAETWQTFVTRLKLPACPGRLAQTASTPMGHHARPSRLDQKRSRTLHPVE